MSKSWTLHVEDKLTSGNSVFGNDVDANVDGLEDDNEFILTSFDMIAVVSMFSPVFSKNDEMLLVSLTAGTIVVIKFVDVVTATVVSNESFIFENALNFVVDDIIELFIKIHKYNIEIDKQMMLKCNNNILFGKFNWN